MAVHVVDWPADSLLRGNFVVALVFRKALIFLGAAALGTDNGGTLVEQRIFNALAMFGEGIRWYSIGWEKTALARFFRRLKRSTGDVATKSEYYLLFLRLRVDAYQSFDFNFQTRLFPHFTAHGLVDSLSQFHAATREIPPISITAMSKENTSLVVKDQGKDANTKNRGTVCCI